MLRVITRAVSGRAVSGRFKFSERKVGVRDLEFLEADDIGIGAAEPVEKPGQPSADRIDVPGGEFHPGRVGDTGPGVNRYIAP